MDIKEKEILDRLANNKRESARLATELAIYRNDRAKRIRHLFFTERKKQTKIAADLGMAQGSVSRIVSGYTCVDIQEQLAR